MKIRQEIAAFIAHKVAQGLQRRSLHMCKLALMALLGPVLDQPSTTLTPERMIELGSKLRQRPSLRTGEPLTEGTLKTYLTICRSFMKWRSLRQKLQDSASTEPLPSEPTEPQATDPADEARHAGELVRRLRENAGLLRSELGQQIGLSVSILRNLERGMTAAPKIWRTLLAHPSMAELPEVAKQEGIHIEAMAKQGRPPTVEEAIGLYLDQQHDRGVRESSIRTCGTVLRSVFWSALSAPLTSLYPTRARELVDGLPTRLARNKGTPLTPTTCQAYREQAHAFLGWCAKQKRIPANPLTPNTADRSADRGQR